MFGKLLTVTIFSCLIRKEVHIKFYFVIVPEMLIFFFCFVTITVYIAKLAM